MRAESSFWGILPIFRGPFLERIAYDRHLSTLRELGDCFSDFAPPSINDPLKDWFEFFYSLLLEQYRCEYVYKNTVATNLYLDRYQLPEDSVLSNEFRAGNSRADVAIINCTSTVFEIKSQYDSLSRLEQQIVDYRSVFDRIFIVTTDKKAKSVLDKIDPLIGVMVLDDSGTLDEIREARSNKANTDPAAIFNCMRQAEFCSAIEDVHGYIPDVPNSKLYRESKKLFCQLSPSDAHDLMVSKIRTRGKRKPFSDLINDAPNSLKHACLSFSKSQALAFQIKERLKKPLLS